MKAKTQNSSDRRKRRGIKRKPEKTVFLLLSLVMLMLFAGMVFRYTEIARLGREVSELDHKIDQLSAQRDSLKLQMSPHTKKTYIEEIAAKELGMEYNTEGIAIASIEDAVAVDDAPQIQNSTIFGQLSLFVFSLLYR